MKAGCWWHLRLIPGPGTREPVVIGPKSMLTLSVPFYSLCTWNYCFLLWYVGWCYSRRGILDRKWTWVWILANPLPVHEVLMSLKSRHRWRNRGREDEELGACTQVYPILELPFSSTDSHALLRRADVPGGCNLHNSTACRGIAQDVMWTSLLSVHCEGWFV